MNLSNFTKLFSFAEFQHSLHFSDLNSSLDSNVFGNPIGWLQELCTARRWPPPMYENELELGLPHERQFTIACVVSKYREVGQGKSKKIAKRLAAHKMWINIHKNALAKSKANQDLDDDANNEVRNRFLLTFRTVSHAYGKRKLFFFAPSLD